MQVFSLIMIVFYCVVSLVLAVRLLSMARRTRELPELIVGLAFLMGGMLGYPFNVASGFLMASARPEAAQVSYVVGQVGMASAAFCLVIAWQNIFFPTLRGGRIWVAVWGGVMAAALAYALSITGPGIEDRLTKAPYLGLLVLEGCCYGIMAFASLRHARMLKRRCALGLSDPVVANRLWLWGMSNFATTISYVYPIIAGLALSRFGSQFYYPVVIVGLGCTSAICITLGFLPPRAYLARIRANAAAGGA